MTPLLTGVLAQLDAKISETNFQRLFVLCIETCCMDQIGANSAEIDVLYRQHGAALLLFATAIAGERSRAQAFACVRNAVLNEGQRKRCALELSHFFILFSTKRFIICLDTYMPFGVYNRHGICLRNHCGAKPAGDLEPAGLGGAVRRRDRASTSHVAANRVEALASAARIRFRGIDGGCTAPSLPAPARTLS